MRRLSSAALAAALLAVMASSADAATKTVAKSAQGGPVLAGSKVIYGVGRGTDSGSGTELGVDLRVVTVSGGRPSTLYKFNRPTNSVDTNDLIGLDADGSRWAAVREATTTTGDGPDTDSEPLGADLVAGSIGKKPSRLLSSFGKPSGCSKPRFDDPDDVAVVDGGLAIAVTPSCGSKSLIDVRLGKTSIRLKGRRPRGGGRWLAYVDGAAVVIYDVKLRREAYRVAGEAGETPIAFDPQGDGKVAVQWNGDRDVQRLAWYSKAENRAHDLGVAAKELEADTDARLAMAADTVVLTAVTNADTNVQTVVAVSLDGKRTKIDDVSGLAGTGGLDFDGRRVAWSDFKGVRVADLP